jgi:CheY-like chemotaxis protein
MSKRILVVEDQPDSRRIIRDILAASDYQITEAENGERPAQNPFELPMERPLMRGTFDCLAVVFLFVIFARAFMQ